MACNNTGPTPSVSLKRGSTCSLGGYAYLPLGYAWTGTSEVKDGNGDVIDYLTVTLLEPVAPYNTAWPLLLEAPASQTLLWPLGPLYCDIRFEEPGGTVLYSPTFIINVVIEITDV